MSALENEPSRDGGRVLVVLFVVYLALLTWIVLWKLEVPYAGGGVMREVKLVPFAPSAGAGASTPLEVVVNFLLFVPFGLYLGLLVPSWPQWKAVIVVAATSVILEVAQYVLAVGSSDITDIIVNTAGGLAGIGLLALARRGLQTRTAKVMTRVCLIGTVLALLAVTIFIASPVHFTQPQNAGTPSWRPAATKSSSTKPAASSLTGASWTRRGTQQTVPATSSSSPNSTGSAVPLSTSSSCPTTYSAAASTWSFSTRASTPPPPSAGCSSKYSGRSPSSDTH